MPVTWSQVVKEGQRLVVRKDQPIDSPVIVKIAGGQSSANSQNLEGWPGTSRDVDQTAAHIAEQKLGRHGIGCVGPKVVDVAVGNHEVKVPVIVGVQEGNPEAQHKPSRNGQADSGGILGEQEATKVAEKGGRLAVEVRYNEVEPPVFVDVAGSYPHASLVASGHIGGNTGGGPDLLEVKAAEVAEQVVRRRIVGDEKINEPVIVKIGREDSQAAAVAIDNPGLFRHVDEPARVIPENVVWSMCQASRVAVRRLAGLGVRADLGVIGIPFKIMADIKVQVAVAVQVSECRRGRPVAVAP